jgi:hypothetical protein
MTTWLAFINAGTRCSLRRAAASQAARCQDRQQDAMQLERDVDGITPALAQQHSRMQRLFFGQQAAAKSAETRRT